MYKAADAIRRDVGDVSIFLFKFLYSIHVFVFYSCAKLLFYIFINLYLNETCFWWIFSFWQKKLLLRRIIIQIVERLSTRVRIISA